MHEYIEREELEERRELESGDAVDIVETLLGAGCEQTMPAASDGKILWFFPVSNDGSNALREAEYMTR